MHVELIIPDYLIYFILILIIYNLYNQISLIVHTKIWARMAPRACLASSKLPRN